MAGNTIFSAIEPNHVKHLKAQQHISAVA